MADATRPIQWTDEEIRLVGVGVTRLYLEVERGLRNRDHLRRFLTPQAFTAQFSDGVSRFPDAGPVRVEDIGAITYARTDVKRAMLSVVARQQDDQWGAVCIELQPDARGCWHVAELTRVQDRNLVHPTPDRSGLREDTERRDRVRAMELQAIHAALAAAADRRAAAKTDLDQLRASPTPDPEAEEAARSRLTATAAEERRWSKALAELTATTPPSHDRLHHAHDARRPRYVTRLLGPEPVDQSARATWRAGAAILDVYRRAAGITDDRTALGPVPANPALAEARKVALRHLDDLAHHLQPDRARSTRDLGQDERSLEPIALQR